MGLILCLCVCEPMAMWSNNVDSKRTSPSPFMEAGSYISSEANYKRNLYGKN